MVLPSILPNYPYYQMDGIGSQLTLRGEGVAGNKNSGDYE